MGMKKAFKPRDKEIKEIREQIRTYRDWWSDDEIESKINEVSDVLNHERQEKQKLNGMKNLKVDVEREKKRRRVYNLN